MYGYVWTSIYGYVCTGYVLISMYENVSMYMYMNAYMEFKTKQMCKFNNMLVLGSRTCIRLKNVESQRQSFHIKGKILVGKCKTLVEKCKGMLYAEMGLWFFLQIRSQDCDGQQNSMRDLLMRFLSLVELIVSSWSIISFVRLMHIIRVNQRFFIVSFLHNFLRSQLAWISLHLSFLHNWLTVFEI